MIARLRGEHDTHWGRWRPSASRQVAAQRQIVATASDVALLTPAARRHGPGRSRSARRALRWLAVLLAATTGGYLATGWSRAEFSAGALPGLPATPRAWLDAYEAAAVDNPGRVCSELFAPALAQAYARAVHGSCADYFRRITSFSVVVGRVLADGDTAVVELRQTVRPRDWAVILDRRRAGWLAVDLLTGALTR